MERSDDLGALEKLDEAVRALKAAGYRINNFAITDTEGLGGWGNFSKRHIEMQCAKEFPLSEEMEELKKLPALQREEPMTATAGKYGFFFSKDTLTDHVPCDPGRGHEFEVSIQLRRQNDDFKEQPDERK